MVLKETYYEQVFLFFFLRRIYLTSFSQG